MLDLNWISTKKRYPTVSGEVFVRSREGFIELADFDTRTGEFLQRYNRRPYINVDSWASIPGSYNGFLEEIGFIKSMSRR